MKFTLDDLKLYTDDAGNIGLAYHDELTELPDELTNVIGCLEISGTKIEKLPDNLTIGGYLNLAYTPIATLPKNLKVTGDLYIHNTNIEELPETIWIGGDIHPSNIPVKLEPDVVQNSNHKKKFESGMIPEIKVALNKEYCGYKASEDVIDFIDRFLSHQNSAGAETVLKDQFNAGYCYHFAVILKTVFNRGEVCWCAPYGHMCWVDDDGTPYDIYGICISESDHFIPVSFLGDAIRDFTHTNNPFYATEEDIQNIIDRYLKSVNDNK